jgi:hypothetical protein
LNGRWRCSRPSSESAAPNRERKRLLAYIIEDVTLVKRKTQLYLDTLPVKSRVISNQLGDGRGNFK